MFGARASLSLWRYLAVETELTLTPTRIIASSEGALVIGARLHALVPLSPEAALSPFALAGGGIDAVALDSVLAQDDVDGSVHWGLGGRWRVDGRKELRVDARQLMGPARDGETAVLYQLSVGVALRW
jgi:hypothetical protein